MQWRHRGVFERVLDGRNPIKYLLSMRDGLSRPSDHRAGSLPPRMRRRPRRRKEGHPTGEKSKKRRLHSVGGHGGSLWLRRTWRRHDVLLYTQDGLTVRKCHEHQSILILETTSGLRHYHRHPAPARVLQPLVLATDCERVSTAAAIVATKAYRGPLSSLVCARRARRRHFLPRCLDPSMAGLRW